MPQSGPGKWFRTGITLPQLFRMYPDDAAAERWFIEQRWPNGVACHHCGSLNVTTKTGSKSMPFRCRDCRKRFSTRTGTVMQSSKLGFQVWLVAIYLLSTSLKSVSSMKLHRDLGITQKHAWHLAHRIREAWRRGDGEFDMFDGPVEADETFVGGKVKSMSNRRRKQYAGGGPFANKVAVVGVRDRETGKVRTKVIGTVTGENASAFVAEHKTADAKLYTDETAAYNSFDRESVKHSVHEYVRGEIHTNGMESFWSMLKRGIVGTFHKLSAEHLERYTNEFEGRHNSRGSDTSDQMSAMIRGVDGKQLRYRDLVEDGERANRIARGWKPPVHWRHRRKN